MPILGICFYYLSTLSSQNVFPTNYQIHNKKGAKYFDPNSDTDSDSNGCSSDGNATYAMWNSLCSCIGGALGFFFELSPYIQ